MPGLQAGAAEAEAWALDQYPASAFQSAIKLLALRMAAKVSKRNRTYPRTRCFSQSNEALPPKHPSLQETVRSQPAHFISFARRQLARLQPATPLPKDRPEGLSMLSLRSAVSRQDST